MWSSSEVAPAATPPPSTERRRDSTSPSSSATRSAAPACTAAACRPRSSWRPRTCVAPSSTSAEFGITTKGTTVDFAVSQNRKNEIVDRLFKGLSGLLKGRKVTDLFDGTGRLEADGTVTVVDGADAGVIAKGTNVILAAGSVPRTLPGFDIDGTDRRHLR